MRGKNKGWTQAEDLDVLSGRRVEGRTAQERANRRYKLRKFYASSTARVAMELLTRIEFLHSVKRAPKACTESFLEMLRAVAAKLKG